MGELRLPGLTGWRTSPTTGTARTASPSSRTRTSLDLVSGTGMTGIVARRPGSSVRGLEQALKFIKSEVSETDIQNFYLPYFMGDISLSLLHKTVSVTENLNSNLKLNFLWQCHCSSACPLHKTVS